MFDAVAFLPEIYYVLASARVFLCDSGMKRHHGRIYFDKSTQVQQRDVKGFVVSI